MKKENTTPTKEGLHTQGEWGFDTMPLPSRKFIRITAGSKEVAHVLQISHPNRIKLFEDKEAEANAELIVKAVNFYNKLPRLAPDTEVPLPNDEYFLKAVNERKALLDSNRELLEALKELHGYAKQFKAYNTIQNSTHFRVANMIANGLHNKFQDAGLTDK